MRQISMTKMDPLARIWKGDRVLWDSCVYGTQNLG
jgi:hypothetical protein